MPATHDFVRTGAHVLWHGGWWWWWWLGLVRQLGVWWCWGKGEAGPGGWCLTLFRRQRDFRRCVVVSDLTCAWAGSVRCNIVHCTNNGCSAVLPESGASVLKDLLVTFLTDSHQIED